MRSLWHESPTHSALRPAEAPTAAALLRVDAHYSLISTGTERLVATGQVPRALWEEMQVPHQQGSLGLPVAYGYSLVGKVVAPDHALHGRWVHLLHPHQEVAWASAAELFPLPDDVPPLRATLASNVETALNATWDAQVMPGDRVLVVGFGLIGSLVARVLSLLPAVELWVVDKDPLRRDLAQNMGFRTLAPGQVAELPPVDVALHSSVSAAGLQTALDAVGQEGKVVELSWYGTRSVNLQLGGRFHSQRKQLISSQVSRLPASHQARWDFGRRKEAVFRLLAHEAFDAHIGEVLAFAQAPRLFEDIRSGAAQALGYALRYGAD